MKTNKQTIFNEMLIGTLLYSVVLGFFSDYTSLITTKSYSTTFAVAFVMQLLTYATLKFKNQIVQFYKKYQGRWVVPCMIFSLWFVAFSSKFVFLAVLNTIFGSNLDISGFIGLLVIVLVMLLAQNALDAIYKKLA